MELCGSGLVSLLSHTAGDDVLGELLLRELSELGPVASVQHLQHVLGEALAEEGGAVVARYEPLLVEAKLIEEVVVVLLADELPACFNNKCATE